VVCASSTGQRGKDKLIKTRLLVTVAVHPNSPMPMSKVGKCLDSPLRLHNLIHRNSLFSEDVFRELNYASF